LLSHELPGAIAVRSDWLPFSLLLLSHLRTDIFERRTLPSAEHDTRQDLRLLSTTSLTQIAVGGGSLFQRDEVWGINNDGLVYRFNFDTNTFVYVPGSAPCPTCIATGAPNPTILFSQILVGGAADQSYLDCANPYEVWAISNSPVQGAVYRYNYCTSDFENIQTPNPFSQIAVGGAGDVWGLDKFANIWHYGGCVGLGTHSGPYQLGILNPLCGAGDTGSGADTSATSLGWGQLYFLPGSGCDWPGLDRDLFGGCAAESLQQITVGVNDVWGLDANGVIYRYVPYYWFVGYIPPNNLTVNFFIYVEYPNFLNYVSPQQPVFTNYTAAATGSSLLQQAPIVRQVKAGGDGVWACIEYTYSNLLSTGYTTITTFTIEPFDSRLGAFNYNAGWANSYVKGCPGWATYRCHVAGFLFLWHRSERLCTYRQSAIMKGNPYA
jgi:hypothetical protein